MSDNYRFDIIHDKNEILRQAIELVFEMALSLPGNTLLASEWMVKDGWLVIFNYSMSGTETNKLVAKGGPETIYNLCRDWLKEQEYTKEPDMDGSCKKGFRLSTASIPHDIPARDKKEQCVIGMWNQPRDEPGAIFAIKPVWTLYGK